jgi:hypothetical protein
MKEWTEPQLIILVRGQAQEAVLLMCKAAGLDNAATNQYFGCARVPIGGAHPTSAICDPCNTVGSS